ncbi:MAG: antitoxin, RHH family protein [Elusimicrobia bacterium HGW-Elusimicrobia-1]|jgi:hypothetical protein|nr:MAG: antitoxin, RHH family protein [Elusimicrobia bacterium HGW-Elusimicrobia-1]
MTSKTLVVLEPTMRESVERIARENEISISGVCRDLIKEALDIYEDKYWSAVAAQREEGFNWRTKGLSHNKVWGKK